MQGIIDCINKTASEENMDLCASSMGQLHNGAGFKIRVTHVENMSDRLINKWKQICFHYGYDSNIRYTDQTAHVICTKSVGYSISTLYFIISFMFFTLLVYRHV